MLSAGLGSVRIVKTYDLGFENQAEKDLGHSFFTQWTYQPVNSKDLSRYYEIGLLRFFQIWAIFLEFHLLLLVHTWNGGLILVLFYYLFAASDAEQVSD